MQALNANKVNSRNGGFSLIELMTVVAVIGILVAVALPGYDNYMRRMKLADGVAALADYRVALEQYYQDNRNYGPTAGSACVLAGSATSTTNRYFTYACVVGAGSTSTYTVTATNRAASGLGAVGDYVYTLNELNARTTTTFKGVSSGSACWKISGSEC